MKVGARVQSYLHELREPQHSEDVEEEQARAQVLRVEIWQQRGACSVVRGAAWGCSLGAWGCSLLYMGESSSAAPCSPTAGRMTEHGTLELLSRMTKCTRTVQLDGRFVELRQAERLAWQMAERAERGVDGALEGVLEPT